MLHRFLKGTKLLKLKIDRTLLICLDQRQELSVTDFNYRKAWYVIYLLHTLNLLKSHDSDYPKYIFWCAIASAFLPFSQFRIWTTNEL